MNANGSKLGILVVGCGFLGSQRAAAAVAARGTRLVAVHDLDGDLARTVASRHGVLAVPDYEDGLRLPGVSAVVVATPHAHHGAQVRLALEAGKHVLCEKPLTIDPDEARDLAHRADRRRLRLATGLNHRFYPPVRDALRLAEAGAIGRVEEVRTGIGHMADPGFLRGWHTDVELSGGGTLIDNGPHACDLIRRLLGEVDAARGDVWRDLYLPEGCESEAMAWFRGRDGGFGELRSSWTRGDGYLTIEVVGKGGRLRVETAPWKLSGTLADGRRLRRGYLADRVLERAARLRHGCERSHVREMEAFASPPAAHPRPGATGWDGCRVTEMIDAAYRSARTGAEIPLTPLPVNLPGARPRGDLTAEDAEIAERFIKD